MGSNGFIDKCDFTDFLYLPCLDGLALFTLEPIRFDLRPLHSDTYGSSGGDLVLCFLRGVHSLNNWLCPEVLSRASGLQKQIIVFCPSEGGWRSRVVGRARVRIGHGCCLFQRLWRRSIHPLPIGSCMYRQTRLSMHALIQENIPRHCTSYYLVACSVTSPRSVIIPPHAFARLAAIGTSDRYPQQRLI